MKSHNLAWVWCSGDLPFRPRWLAKQFVLSRVVGNPARAAALALYLEKHHGPSVGETFVMHIELYQQDAWKWRYHELAKAEKANPSRFFEWSAAR